LFVDASTDCVGIGTTAAIDTQIGGNAKLGVYDASGARVGIWGNGGRWWYLHGEDSNALQIGYRASSNTTDGDAITIKTGPLVGIGTTAPMGVFHAHNGGTQPTAFSGLSGVFSKTTGGATQVSLYSTNDTVCDLLFSDPEDVDVGRVRYDHSSNSMSLTTNAATQMTIDSSGNVGIGTPSPDADLHVVGSTIIGVDAATGPRLRAVGSGDDFYLQTSNSSTGGTGTKLHFSKLNSTDTTMTVDTSSKKVGIGTTSPSEKLEVVGNAILDATDANLKLKAGGGGTTGAVYYTFNTDSTIYGRVDLPYDTRASVGLRMKSASGYPITIDSGNGILFGEDGTAHSAFDNAGKLGIGTTSPANALHVVGNDEETSAINTATATSLEVAGNGTGTNSGGTILFSAASGSWKFAAIKALVQNGTSNTAGDLAFSTRPVNSDSTLTEAMRIRYNGNVGIGTTTPNAKLQIRTSASEVEGISVLNAGNTSEIFKVIEDGSNGGYVDIRNSSNTSIIRLNSSGDSYFNAGDVGIGTTSPSVPLQVDATGEDGILLRNDVATNLTPLIEVRGQRSDANNSQACGGGLGLTRWAPNDQIVDTNTVGSIYFGGAHGATTADEANILYTASIKAEADETWSSSTNMATDLVFRTGSTGRAYAYNLSYGDSEVMRIVHEARVGIGTSSPAYKLDINDDAATGAGLRVTGGGGGSTIARFERDVGSSGCFVDVNCSSGDPQIRFTESSGVDWSIGVEGNVFEIVDGSALNGASKFEITSTGDASAVGNLGATGGTISAGFPDVTSGLLNLYGGATGNEGGEIKIFTTAPYDTTYDYYFIDAYQDDLRIGRAGNNDITLTSGGNVGIGDFTPSYKLDVNGTFRTTDDIYNNISGTQSSLPGYHKGTYGAQIESTDTGSTLHIARSIGNCMNIGADSNATVVYFRDTSAGTTVATQVGSISITSSATAFNTSSDYRLKENEVSITDGIDRLKQLSPYRFNFKVDPDKIVDGFFAHEVSDVVPEAIRGEKDGMKDEEYVVSPAVYEDVVHPAVEATYDEDGQEITPAQEERTESVLVTEAVMGTLSVPDYQGIDQSKLVPLLTAALQEAITKIEENAAEIATLKTQVAALTSNSPE
jgi:hypothetical protein